MKRSAGVAIIYKNKVLLVHPTNGRWQYSYSIPKGGIDPGETPLHAALREVKEEIGIKLKEGQLDPIMHTIEYKATKERKGVKVGSIYKTVNYWTCHIKELSEIGLETEKVPNNQLQLEEVDWAGFVSYEEFNKRISNKMKSIIKHIDMAEQDKIPGGFADKYSVEDIAKKHDVSVEAIQKQIDKGVKIEMEHVDDESLAREIAMDHLVEFPDYYDKLEDMEKGAEAEDKTNESVEDDVKKFLQDNPNPDDSQVHKFAEELGMHPDELEDIIYKFATKGANESIFKLHGFQSFVNEGMYKAPWNDVRYPDTKKGHDQERFDLNHEMRELRLVLKRDIIDSKTEKGIEKRIAELEKIYNERFPQKQGPFYYPPEHPIHNKNKK